MPHWVTIRLLVHALLFGLPVAYLFGLAQGKDRESAATVAVFEQLPPVCQERLWRAD